MNNVVSIHSAHQRRKKAKRIREIVDALPFFAGVLLSLVLPWLILAAYAGAPVLVAFVAAAVTGIVIGRAMHDEPLTSWPSAITGTVPKVPPRIPMVLKRAA